VKPITVSTTVERPIQEVWDYLDLLGNHEQFTDHMLIDWNTSGPERGVGAKAHVKGKSPGRTEDLEIEVKSADPPHRSVENTIGAKGKRITQGTYELTAEGESRTRVQFTLEYLQGPAAEKLLLPLLRGWLAKANQKAMDRLRERLSS
jgi:uncharacterized protein YndB with AHSA1/START domain